jgi:hypothetical protein
MSEAEERKPTVFDGPGRGRKQCQNCQSYVGVRNKTCPVCGTAFANKYAQRTVKVAKLSKPKKAEAETKETKPTMRIPEGIDPNRVTHRILIPAGKCPAKLESADREAIEAWIKEIESVYAKRHEILMPEGYRYYARYFFDVHSDEFKGVQQTIVDILEPGQTFNENDE